MLHWAKLMVLFNKLWPDLCRRLPWAFICNILVLSNYPQVQLSLSGGQADSDRTHHNARVTKQLDLFIDTSVYFEANMERE